MKLSNQIEVFIEQDVDYTKITESLINIYKQILGLPEDMAVILATSFTSHMFVSVEKDIRFEASKFLNEFANRIVVLNNDSSQFTEKQRKLAKRLGKQIIAAIDTEQRCLSEFMNIVKAHIHFEELLPPDLLPDGQIKPEKLN